MFELVDSHLASGVVGRFFFSSAEVGVLFKCVSIETKTKGKRVPCHSGSLSDAPCGSLFGCI